MNIRRGIKVTVEVGDGSREVHEVIGTSSDTVETRSESGAGDTFMRSTMTSADGTSRILGITESQEPSVAGSAHKELKGIVGISSKILKMVEEIEPKKSR